MTASSRRWVGWVLVVVFAGAVVIWGAAQLAAHNAPPRLGGTAPDFTLQSTEGQTISLAAQRGKPTVVIFVASWYEVCREEMPTMVETFRAHQAHGVVFLGVDVYEEEEVAQQFRQEFQIPFPLLVDANGEVTGRYRVNGTPTTFFLDPDGVLRDVVVGGPLDRDYLDNEIAALRKLPAP